MSAANHVSSFLLVAGYENYCVIFLCLGVRVIVTIFCNLLFEIKDMSFARILLVVSFERN